MAQRTPDPYFPLPEGLADPRGVAGKVFDLLADTYDAARPGYPPEAIAGLTLRCGLGAGSAVVEIGCGTGQLTRDLARCGSRICCVEPGLNLARRAGQNLAEFANVEVVTSSFEDFVEIAGSYDAVVAATSFHWVDPVVAFEKAARILRPSGHIALLTNSHCAGGTQELIATEIRELHRRLAPQVGDWTFPSVGEVGAQAELGDDIALLWSRVERKLGDAPTAAHLFYAPIVSVHPFVVTYDTVGYLAMLSTQSTYALMDTGPRHELLGAIGEVIDDRVGGVVTKQYATVLATARCRERP